MGPVMAPSDVDRMVDEGLVRFEGDDLVIPDAARLAAAARR